MSESFFKELKRRNVFRVGIGYLVLAWVVIQVTDSAVPALHLPEWVNSLVFLLGAIGFPFALFFAWAFEITPDGIKPEAEVNRDNSIVHHTGRKLDFIIIGLLIIGMGYFIWESRFATEPEAVLVTENESAQSSAITEEIQQPEGSSIAVLPFVNMSDDAANEYFSDGISEEILNVLAKIPRLHVTSRSSAFAFKGSQINISDVAAKLGVKNVLEGSVRKSGKRIRITAQLIAAGSDKHLWSETYDRELTTDNIFEIQDDISSAIVDALKTELGLDTKLARREMKGISLEAHNQYLKGRFFVENRNQDDLEVALAHFKRATELSADYAPAWMGIAWTNYFLNEFQYGQIPLEIALESAIPALEKALSLDPELAEAYAVYGLIEDSKGNFELAQEYYNKSIALNPNFSDAYVWKAGSPLVDFEIDLALLKTAVQLNPMSLIANLNYANRLINFGRMKEAYKVAEHMLQIDDSSHMPYSALGQIYSAEGNISKAIAYQIKAAKLSPGRIGFNFNIATNFATMNMNKEAAAAMKDTAFSVFTHFFSNNAELFLSQTRERFPRAEDDSIGNFVRGQAEAVSENYNDAAKYFKLSNFCKECADVIYSYLQTGNEELATIGLDELRKYLTWAKKAGLVNFNGVPIEVSAMELAHLEGYTDKAIEYLHKGLNKAYIINHFYKIHPMYKDLRAHPDWPALLEKSERRATEQRETYLNLVAAKI